MRENEGICQNLFANETLYQLSYDPNPLRGMVTNFYKKVKVDGATGSVSNCAKSIVTGEGEEIAVK
ncbi:MAG TPA: hypothetical protein VGY98_07910 [Verrucomicrobiae bacterium]|nr:hypothetical protein [Verrucomicrobiae bacterium]